MKKILRTFIAIVFFGTLFLVKNNVQAETITDFVEIVNEDFDKVQNAFWDETIFWANNGVLSTDSNEVIDGEKSLKFLPSTTIGDWTDLGGTSENEVLIQEGTYQISLKVKAQGVDFLVIKIKDAKENTYYEFLVNPLTGKKLNSNGEVIPVNENETINFNNNITSLSFTFDALNAVNSYIALSTRTSGEDPYLIIDDTIISKETNDVNYRIIAEDNFDNSQGEVHTSSLFWVNDTEGTTGTFTDNETESISGKSLRYQINKVGWDILGGSQGNKLKMTGGESYRVSFDLKLNNTSYFTMKILSISTPEITLYDMYINDQGKRLPGSKRISHSESVEINDGVISVSFTFSSDLSNNAYIYLNAYGNQEGASVILDNVKIEQEIVEIPNITYNDYFNQDFETNNTGVIAPKGTITDKELVISGKKSLIVKPENMLRWMDILTIDENEVEIKNDQYKFHFKTRLYDISQVKVQVIDSNNQNIYHEFNFDGKSLQRIAGIGKGYLDNGNLSIQNGIVVGYFELPELETDTNYTIKISAFPLSKNAYMVFDDINVLKELPEQTIDESKFTRPGGLTPTDSELPNGKGDIDYNILNKIDFVGIGITALVTLTLIVGGYMVLRIAFNKREYQNRGKLFLSLLTFIVIGGVSAATGIFTISPRLEVSDMVNLTDKDSENYVYVYPDKIKGHLSNPGMGWVALEEPTYGGHPDLGSSGNIPEVDNISISTTWARIEKVEGVYDFTLIDKVIDYYTALGKHINLRISTDSLMLPNTYEGVPSWLIEKYNIPFEMVNYTDPGPVRTFKSIDLRDPNYLRYLDMFLNALSEKYKNNPYVDVVEIRGFGNWGEWHSGYSFPTDANRMNTLAKIIDKYYNAFKDTGKLLVLSAAWDPYYMPYDTYDEYVEVSAFDYLMTLPNATFRRDSGANLLNYGTDERLLSDFFRSGKRLPLLGEYASGVDAALNENFGFDLMGGIDDILFKMRPNYSTVLGWVNSEVARLIDAGHEELYERGNEKLGYRLAVDMARFPKSVAPGNEFTLLTSFSNSGVGRFWYNYPLKVELVDENGNVVSSTVNQAFDARTFVLGEINNVYTNINIPNDINSGKYNIVISIVDNDENPAIKLGMAGEINNTKRYNLGSIEVKQGSKKLSDLAYKTTYNEIKDYEFAPNTTYMVTFKYKPDFDMRNYEFGNYDGYTFALTSKNGGEGATVGYNKWQDISGEVGYKTFVFTTQNYKDYKLKIQSENFGNIEVTDMYIEKIGGYYEHFENYDFTDSKSIYYPMSTQNVSISTDSKEVITGNTSVVINTKAKGDVDALTFDTNLFALKPNTAYTVTFKFKNLSLVGKGGYMYLNLDSENDSRRIAEWYERNDTPYTTKSFTFNTSDEAKQSIVFGMHDGGKYAIDDIIISEHTSGKIVEGKDIISPRNERPNLDLGGTGVLEDFEDSSFYSSSFDWGFFGWGQFTYDSEYVISGESSLMGKVEKAALENEWFEFAHSKLDAYQFKPNTTYTLEFKYRIIDNPVNDGRFYVLFRSNSLGFSHDAGYHDLPVLSTDDLGKVFTFKQDITIGNASDYKLIFGMHWLGTIVIDDVLVTEKTN